MPNKLVRIVLHGCLTAALAMTCPAPIMSEPPDAPRASEVQAAQTASVPADPSWKGLLETAWETTSSAREQLDRMYAEAQRHDPSRLVGDAYLLGLIKQHRYEDGLKWVSESKGDNGSVPLDVYRGRTHVWLLTALRKYDAAPVRLGELLASLPSTDWEKWSPAERGLLSFAGRISGFLLGPAQTPAGQKAYDATVTPAVAKLPQPAQDQFELSRQEVLQQFETLRDEVEQLRQLERQRQEETKSQEKDRIDKESAELERRQQELDREQQQLRDQLRDQLHTLSQQDVALASRLGDLGMTADILFDSVVRSEIGLAALVDLYESTDNDAIALWWLTQIDALDIRQSRELLALRDVDRVARFTQSQRNRTRQEAAVASQAVRNQAQQIDNERMKMVEWQKKLSQKKRKLERPTTTISRDLRQKQQQLRALNTYEPYPLEVVRAYLLKRNE